MHKDGKQSSGDTPGSTVTTPQRRSTGKAVAGPASTRAVQVGVRGLANARAATVCHSRCLRRTLPRKPTARWCAGPPRRGACSKRGVRGPLSKTRPPRNRAPRAVARPDSCHSGEGTLGPRQTGQPGRTAGTARRAPPPRSPHREMPGGHPPIETATTVAAVSVADKRHTVWSGAVLSPGRARPVCRPLSTNAMAAGGGRLTARRVHHAAVFPAPPTSNDWRRPAMLTGGSVTHIS